MSDALATTSSSLPSFLAGAKDLAAQTAANLQDLVILPRWKIPQPMTKKAILDKYNVGDVLLTPNYEMVAPYEKGTGGKPFDVAIIFQYREFFWLNPLNFVNSGLCASIADQTSDEHSEVALAARDPKKQLQNYLNAEGQTAMDNGKVAQKRAVESINFVAVLQDHPIQVPFVMSFARGEFTNGRKLSTLLASRAAGGIPLFAGRYTGKVAQREGKKGTWYGADFTISATPFVSEEKFAEYKEEFFKLKKLHEAKLLKTNMDETPDDGETDNVTANARSL